MSKQILTEKNYDEGLKQLALFLAANAVRNTVIEDYHAGTHPSSKTGDYSDVKVVSPFGEIPWQKLSRISDKEMKAFMMEVVNKLYTLLQYYLSPYHKDEKSLTFGSPILHSYYSEWDQPEFDAEFLGLIDLLKHGPSKRSKQRTA